MTRNILLILLNRFIVACIVLIGVAPILSTVVAAQVANANGCTLNESGPQPCVINGVDYGETLLNMAMMVLLTLVSVPIAIGLFVIYVIVWGVILIVMVVRRRRAPAAATG
jgi:hypothetical protein